MPSAFCFGRAINFSRNNVALFFNNYKNIGVVSVQIKFGIVTKMDVHQCQQPNEIIYKEGVKHVSKIVSTERVTLVLSMLYEKLFLQCCVASCSSLGPIVSWFTNRFHWCRTHSRGISATKFNNFLKHFAAHVNCTPMLLILE